MSWRSAAVGVVLVLVCGIVANAASAHGRSTSYSVWSFGDEEIRVRARVSRLDLTRLALDPVGSARDSERVAALLARQLRLSAGGQPCEPTGVPIANPAEKGWVVYAWSLACSSSGERIIASDLLLDVAPGHLHFARLVRDGDAVERVLSEANPTWVIDRTRDSGPSSSGGGSGLGDYVGLGVGHILTGWDHLVFVLALLLLAATIGEVAALVTAFTVAHSVTLALAVLGFVHPETHVVEALIGFSIALVAAENAWILAGRERWIPAISVGALVLLALLGAGGVPRLAYIGLALFTACHFGLLRDSRRPARLRAAVAFAFGLVHGFGFAGVLAEMSLPVERLVPALFGFNLGVEAGQLVVVLLVWPLLRALARLDSGRVARLTTEIASATVCGLGLFWFVTRSFG